MKKRFLTPLALIAVGAAYLGLMPSQLTLLLGSRRRTQAMSATSRQIQGWRIWSGFLLG